MRSHPERKMKPQDRAGRTLSGSNDLNVVVKNVSGVNFLGQTDLIARARQNEFTHHLTKAQRHSAKVTVNHRSFYVRMSKELCQLEGVHPRFCHDGCRCVPEPMGTDLRLDPSLLRQPIKNPSHVSPLQAFTCSGAEERLIRQAVAHFQPSANSGMGSLTEENDSAFTPFPLMNQYRTVQEVEICQI